MHYQIPFKKEVVDVHVEIYLDPEVPSESLNTCNPMHIFEACGNLLDSWYSIYGTCGDLWLIESFI